MRLMQAVRSVTTLASRFDERDAWLVQPSADATAPHRQRSHRAQRKRYRESQHRAGEREPPAAVRE